MEHLNVLNVHADMKRVMILNPVNHAQQVVTQEETKHVKYVHQTHTVLHLPHVIVHSVVPVFK